MSGVELTDRERAVVNAFQGGFPVVRRPFEPAAEALASRGVDVDAAGLRDVVADLDERGVLSRFGALVNADEIGGTATLVAMHAPEERYDEVAEAVNDHRAVAHNYERDHPHLNMWFVLSVADAGRVEEVLAAIERETGQRTYDMPKLTEFRVRARFPVDGPLADDPLDLSELGPAPEPSAREGLSAGERDLVVAIQDGLPITETPYADVASEVDRDVEWVLETLRRFDVEGKVRRVGVVPNHYALGYTENAMTVWDVPDEAVQTSGEDVAALDFVTHCYERPRHEGVWPYNVFAMVHGRTEAEAAERIDAVVDRMDRHWDVAEGDWDTLYSTRILKKTGIRIGERAAANTA